MENCFLFAINKRKNLHISHSIVKWWVCTFPIPDTRSDRVCARACACVYEFDEKSVLAFRARACAHSVLSWPSESCCLFGSHIKLVMDFASTSFRIRKAKKRAGFSRVCVHFECAGGAHQFIQWIPFFVHTRLTLLTQIWIYLSNGWEPADSPHIHFDCK